MKKIISCLSLSLMLTSFAFADPIKHKNCRIQIDFLENVKTSLGDSNFAALTQGLNEKGYTYVEPNSVRNSELVLLIGKEEPTIEIRDPSEFDAEDEAELAKAPNGLILKDFNMDEFLGGKLVFESTYDLELGHEKAIEKFLKEAPNCVQLIAKSE